MNLRINQSGIKLWNECREKHRLTNLVQLAPVAPNIHFAFGHVIHKMAEGYWSGKPYMESFQMALEATQEVDPRLLTAANNKKWVDIQESIAPITTLYYGIRGDNIWPKLSHNETLVEVKWGTYAGVEVTLFGTIDRFEQWNGTLTDTKTCSAVGYNWKADLKKRLLREPQMSFYTKLIQMQGYAVKKMQYELIVKPYRGSDPKIEYIDVTEEVLDYQPVFEHTLSWTIREMCEFYANCQDAQPWPMSNTACVSQWGDCEFLPICSGKSGLDDTKLYRIKIRTDHKC